MLRLLYSRVLRSAACALLAGVSLRAQTSLPNIDSPASVPAGVIPGTPKEPTTAPPSTKRAREADDAYLDGAKHIDHNDLAAAERSFARAVQLAPTNQTYVQALALTREHRITALVRDAATARQNGDAIASAKLLAQASAIDPENLIVSQHLAPNIIAPNALNHTGVSETLAGPVEFAPTPGKQSFHRRGDPQDLTRAVYTAFGIAITFDDSVSGGPQIKFDLDDADFATATRVLQQMSHIFVVPLQAKSGIAAKDTEENRQRLVPQVEETIYLPGITADAMTELANLARNVFDMKQVTASSSTGQIVLRGDEPTLKLVNATYADMLDGGSDVLLDIHLYEINKSFERNIGATLPASAQAFDLVSSAQNLINANQDLINQAVSGGILPLPNPNLSSPIDQLYELFFLIKAGVSGASQFSSLLGTFGTFAGLPLAGLSVSSTSTFNLLLTSSDVRTIDNITLRGGDKQPLNFRAGTRYPVVTATYSSGVSSALASQLAGVKINGVNVSSLLASTQANIPQFQFEDLGITLKATPHILHTGEVSLQLELKIEALGGGAINSIPILNSRALTSSVTVPAGQSALLVSEVNKSEIHAIDGLPGLSELPGFQGTDKDQMKNYGELLITITPHIVRPGALHIASRMLATGPSRGPQ